ncbi:hypothetical protein ACWIGI_26445 [Nocardia sp. NPDC055321]
MYRPVLNVIVGGSFALAVALQPALAAAAPSGPAVETPTEVATRSYAPFDPICPLCFIREFIESGSVR